MLLLLFFRLTRLCIPMYEKNITYLLAESMHENLWYEHEIHTKLGAYASGLNVAA